MSSSSAAASIIYLGLDVHKDSVTIAVLPADASAPTRIDKFPNDFAQLRRVFERHAKDGESRAGYEASGAGYVLQRAMQGWGYHCDVIAASLEAEACSDALIGLTRSSAPNPTTFSN